MARRIEVFTRAGRRRRWNAEIRARIVAESYAPSVGEVADQYGLGKRSCSRGSARPDCRVRAPGAGVRARGAESAASPGDPGGGEATCAEEDPALPPGRDGPAALIEDEMRADPFSAVIYVFRAKRVDGIKLLYGDGTGVLLVAKTLEHGPFRWPRGQDGAVRLTASQLGALLDGLGWARV